MPNAYISIANCSICRNIPGKINFDHNQNDSPDIPPEFNRIPIIVKIEEYTGEQYCTSVTMLRKCPQCGTYYYQNEYDDEGQHFMDPTTHDTTIRRYTPLTAMHFLKGLIAKAPGTLPPTFGALKKAFLEGTTTRQTEVVDADVAKKIEVASRELEELQNRYPGLIQEMITAITTISLDWHVKIYIMEVLLGHFIKEGNFEQIWNLLLHHKDPVIQVEAAGTILGIATSDAPVIDLVHVPVEAGVAAKNLLVDKAHILQIARMLFEVALHNDLKTLEYDHGYGQSKYVERNLRIKAVYQLNLAADLVDVGFILPQILTLVSKYIWMGSSVFWLLKTMAIHRKAHAQLILAELEKFDEATKKALAKEFAYISLKAECKKKLRKKKTTRKKT